MKTVLLCTGQGSQKPGMGQELMEIHPACKEIFACAGDIFHIDLAAICREGDEAKLAQTQVAQPAIMAVSLAGFSLLKSLGVQPFAAAGHSLGEYASMVICGIVSIEDGFRILKIRSSLMEEAAKEQDGMMCAVLGTDVKTIERICEKIDPKGSVLPVNYNAPLQTVIAGKTPAVKKAMDQLAPLARKLVPLKVNAAFHTELMRPAAEAFEKALDSFSFQKPSLPFYSNLLAAPLKDTSNMPAYLAKHMVSPVRFTEELTQMQKDGADTFVELGPSKVLSGLTKKTLDDVSVHFLGDRASYEALCQSGLVQKG